MKKAISLLFLLSICLFGSACGSALVVNSSGDEPDVNINDGKCETSLNECTLRAAIMEANVSDDVSKITFENITSIYPNTPLPVLSASNTHIDADGNVTLDGSLITEGSISGLKIRNSSYNIIQGLRIRHFWFGITIHTHQGLSATHNTIGFINSLESLFIPIKDCLPLITR